MTIVLNEKYERRANKKAMTDEIWHGYKFS